MYWAIFLVLILVFLWIAVSRENFQGFCPGARLQLIHSGGIMGKYDPMPVLYIDALPLDKQAKLKELIDKSNFFSLPNNIKSPGADLFYDTLIIRNMGQYNSVTADFMQLTPQSAKFKELVDYVKTLYRR